MNKNKKEALKIIGSIEKIIIILKENSVPYKVLYYDNFKDIITKSEFTACIQDLKKEGFIESEGSFEVGKDEIDVVLSRVGETEINEHNTYAEYLISKEGTLYDRVVKRLKDNIIVVIILIVFAVFTSLCAFNKDFKDFFFSEKSKEEISIIPKKIKDSVEVFKKDSIRKFKDDSLNRDFVKKENARKSIHIKDSLDEVNKNKKKDNRPQSGDGKNKQIPDVPPKKIEDKFCKGVVEILNELSDRHTNYITNNENSYTSLYNSLNFGIYTSFIGSNKNEFEADFYYGDDKSKALNVYTELKDSLKCIGVAGEDDVTSVLHTRISLINYQDKQIKIIYDNDRVNHFVVTIKIRYK